METLENRIAAHVEMQHPMRKKTNMSFVLQITKYVKVQDTMTLMRLMLLNGHSTPRLPEQDVKIPHEVHQRKPGH